MFRVSWPVLLVALILATVPFAMADSYSAQVPPGPGTSSSGRVEEPQAPASAEPEEHGLSESAPEIARVFGFPITNSMAVSWVVAFGLILFAQIATRKMDKVPAGAQNFLEWLVGGLYTFLEGILGPHLTKRTFWFFATIFIFILSAN